MGKETKRIAEDHRSSQKKEFIHQNRYFDQLQNKCSENKSMTSNSDSQRKRSKLEHTAYVHRSKEDTENVSSITRSNLITPKIINEKHVDHQDAVKFATMKARHRGNGKKDKKIRKYAPKNSRQKKKEKGRKSKEKEIVQS